MIGYTDKELQEIAANLRKFARQGKLEHFRDGGKGEVIRYDLPLSKDRTRLLMAQAILHENKKHGKIEVVQPDGTPIKPEVHTGHEVWKIDSKPQRIP